MLDYIRKLIIEIFVFWSGLWRWWRGYVSA